MEDRSLAAPAARRALGSWLPALAWLVLIHAASARSPGELGFSLPPGVDKALHLCEFGALAGLLWRPVRAWEPGWPEMRAAAAVFAFVALNALLDEAHQAWVPGRIPSWGDAGADLAGGALALAWVRHREKARPGSVNKLHEFQ